MAELTLDLPEALEVSGVSALAEDWVSRLQEAEGPLRLAGSGIRRVDAAGLQLLYALIRAAGEQGRAVEWLSVSDTLLDAARLADMARALRLPTATEG